MALQLLLNIVIAVVWVLLHNTWDIGTFVIGYAIGLTMMYLIYRFLPQPFYLRRAVACIKLFVLFNVELIKSGIAVARQVLSPKLHIRPGIIAVPTELSSDLEITLLANCITLTPGTLVIEVSPENDMLYVHALDIDDEAQLIDSIKNSFEKAIMEVTR